MMDKNINKSIETDGIRRALLLGIYGTTEIEHGTALDPDVTMVLEGEFPSYFIPAGKNMKPETVVDHTGKPVSISSYVKGRPCPYNLYRFVLPFTSSCDLGSMYVPVEEESVENADDAIPLIPRVLFRAYNNGTNNEHERMQRLQEDGAAGEEPAGTVTVRRWMFAHVQEVLKHFTALKAEWKYPVKGFCIHRYPFKRGNLEYRRNISLLIGQLYRFGGLELIAALRIAGGDEFLREAGLWTTR